MARTTTDWTSKSHGDYDLPIDSGKKFTLLVDPNEIAYYVTREDHIIYYSRIDKEDAMWKCDLYLRKSQGNFYVIFDLDSNTYIGQMNIKPSDNGEYTLEVGKPLSTYEYKIEI